MSKGELEVCAHGRGFECVECQRLAGRPSVTEDVACAICFESANLVRIDPCCHDIYCSDCLAKLSDCPMCRTKVRGLLPKHKTPSRKRMMTPRVPAPKKRRQANLESFLRGATPSIIREAFKKRTIADMLRSGDLRPGSGLLSVLSVPGFRGDLTHTGKLVVPASNGCSRRVFDTPANFASEVLARAGGPQKPMNAWQHVVYHPPTDEKLPRRVPKSLADVRDHGYPKPTSSPPHMVSS